MVLDLTRKRTVLTYITDQLRSTGIQPTRAHSLVNVDVHGSDGNQVLRLEGMYILLVRSLQLKIQMFLHVLQVFFILSTKVITEQSFVLGLFSYLI